MLPFSQSDTLVLSSAGGELCVPAEEPLLPSPPRDPPRRALPGDAPCPCQQRCTPQCQLLWGQERQRFVCQQQQGREGEEQSQVLRAVWDLCAPTRASCVKLEGQLSLEAQWSLLPWLWELLLGLPKTFDTSCGGCLWWRDGDGYMSTNSTPSLFSYVAPSPALCFLAK